MDDDFIRDFPDEEPPPRPRAFVPVARYDEIPEGQARRFVISGRAIAVFKEKGTIHACQDRCPHMGAQLSWGKIEGETIVCSWHGWVFDLHDGHCINRKKDWATAEIFPVRMSGDMIEIELPV